MRLMLDRAVSVDDTIDETSVLLIPLSQQIRNGSLLTVFAYWKVLTYVAPSTFLCKLYINGCPNCPYEITDSPIDIGAEDIEPQYGTDQSGLMLATFWWSNRLTASFDQYRYQILSSNVTWLWGKDNTVTPATNAMQGLTYLGWQQNSGAGTVDWRGGTELEMTIQWDTLGNEIQLDQCFLTWDVAHRLQNPNTLTGSRGGWIHPQSHEYLLTGSGGMAPSAQGGGGGPGGAQFGIGIPPAAE